MRYNIQIPEKLNLESLEKLISQAPFGRVTEADSLSFDLSQLRFIRPVGITTLASMIFFLAEQRPAKIEIFPPDDSDVHQYLSRMDFYHQLGIKLQEDFARCDGRGRFRELIRLTSENQAEQAALDLSRILEQNINITKSFIDSLKYSMVEIVDNVFHHSQSKIGGFICAQTYPNMNQIEISIADCGIGIRGSLARNYPYLQAQNQSAQALRMAIQQKVTGNPEKHTGEGLFFTSEVIKQNEGLLCLYSEDAKLYCHKSGTKVQSVPYWQGTIVYLLFRTDRDSDLVALYNQYAPLEDEEIPF